MALQRCCSSLPFRVCCNTTSDSLGVWFHTDNVSFRNFFRWTFVEIAHRLHWLMPGRCYRAATRIAMKEMNKFGIRFLSRMKILNYLFKTSAWQLARKSFQSPKACISSHPSHPEHTPVNTPVKIAHIVFFALSLLIFWSSLPHLPLIAALLSRPFNAISSSDLPFLFCRHSLDLRSKIRARSAFWHEKFG